MKKINIDNANKWKSNKYAVYIKKGKWWFADRNLYTKEKAKELVKGLKENGSKAFFARGE